MASFAPLITHASTEANINQMTSYAVFLGRAIGCGINTENEAQRVGAWLDKAFPPGSADQQTFLLIFAAGMQHHAERQASSKSPDSCSTVRHEYKSIPWP